ncbi:MAG: hypothetical protein VR70_10635 [Rhodospirillaceae bacterium BRH_c57]|nr:MAG: hypothetical protein VR70_10635 [Rhodospirillaceae bacterium BRH_c57]
MTATIRHITAPPTHWVRRGGSTQADPLQAVAEVAAQIAMPDPGLVIFFCAADYDLATLAPVLWRHFPKCPVVGCTTAGVISPRGYQSQGLGAVAFSAAVLQAETALIEDVGALRVTECRQRTQEVRSRLESRTGRTLDSSTGFAFLLCDGLCLNEERVVSAISATLSGIPLVGGSAGDDLQFQTSGVYHGGRFYDAAALLLLADCRLPFRAFSTHNVNATNQRMVVTQAEPARRLVRHLNGAPAAAEYARLLGLAVEDLTPEVLAEHPPVVKMGDDVYVRSIIEMMPDGGLTFGCAVDTGIVLRIGRTGDLVSNLDTTLREVRREVGAPAVVLACDCTLRQVEMERHGLTDSIADTLETFQAVGFSSYGEQINSMHLNQTFTGIAFGAKPRDA